MDWIIYLFGSGAMFFIGVALALVGAAIDAPAWRHRLAMLLAFVGLLLIGLSATPLPYWLYAVAGIATLVWMNTGWIKSLRSKQAWIRALVAAGWLACLAWEVPHHLMPALDASRNRSIHVIADSVTAGMSDSDKETWPLLLARDHPDLEIVSHAKMGATCASALRQAERIPDDAGLVLLEIGGNDLLGTTSSTKFERDLDALLTRVCRPDRVVAMLELPLPPLTNEFGRIQRLLAAKHRVPMMPKRPFAEVLTTPGATVDGIHLTRLGHRLMADVVWRFIGIAVEAKR